MEQVVVSVKNVSKKFRLYNSPKERLWELVHPFNKKYHRDFWALRDVDFEVLRGQTVGIIGRNGSGKSTLLQIICSILQPTCGEVKVDGKTSALLTLGAGFNPDFTGRNNVVMNGLLMGYSKEDMEHRLPTIEAFADIGEFIDQPVRKYSSGMFVRLAFAAAINIDPDILVVDEVLAVGDAKFQQKCFQKFIEFQEARKTTILVTHDTSAVVRHCNHVILLENGALVARGEAKDVVNRYLDILEGRFHSLSSVPAKGPEAGQVARQKGSSVEDSRTLDEFLDDISGLDKCSARSSYNENEYRQGYDKAEIVDYLVLCEGECDPVSVDSGSLVHIYAKVRFHEDVAGPLFGLAVKTVDGLTVYAINSFFTDICVESTSASDILVFHFSVNLRLAPGDFFIDLGVDEQVGDSGQGRRKRQCLYESLDRRCAVIHLYVREKNWFHGLADFEADCQEVARNGRRVEECGRRCL